jgi:hypothetical protein
VRRRIRRSTVRRRALAVAAAAAVILAAGLLLQFPPAGEDQAVIENLAVLQDLEELQEGVEGSADESAEITEVGRELLSMLDGEPEPGESVAPGSDDGGFDLDALDGLIGESGRSG